MAEIPIIVSQLGFRVRVTRHGAIENTMISLRQFNNQLHKWGKNRETRRIEVMQQWYVWDEARGVMYYPRFILKAFLVLIWGNGHTYKLIPADLPFGAPLKAKLREGITPRDELQIAAIAHATRFLPEPKPFVAPFELQTGRGKTYSAIDIATKLGVRAIIVADKLSAQWKGSLLKFTTVTEDDIFMVSGADDPRFNASTTVVNKFVDLIRGINNGTLSPDFIIFSATTYFAYVTRSMLHPELPPPEELSKVLQTGTRITDETHNAFYSVFRMDIQTSDRYIIPLSATIESADSFVSNIMDRHYPPETRFGGHDINQYIDRYAYIFDIDGLYIPEKAVMTSDGYSHVKYEQYLLKHETLLENIWDKVYYPKFLEHFAERDRPANTKCLWLCITVAMCEWIAARLAEAHPEFKILCFSAGVDRDELDDSTYDIIIATDKGVGTGTDIKMLVTNMDLISVKSPSAIKQQSGRTRFMGEDVDTRFVQFANASVKKQVQYLHSNSDALGRLMKSSTVETIHA